MSECFVLDTSAILTLIEDEAGADRVAAVLREEIILIPWLVLMEVYYISQQEQNQAEADRRYALLKQLKARILWEAAEPVVLTAARLKAVHRISLADAIIAAFAIQENGILLHKDPEFELVGDQVTLEALPYK